MNINQLSKRLMCVASYIPSDSTFADIGSDHAYLPCYAVKNHLVKKAVAGEVVEGPFQAAKQQVEEAGLVDSIDVRKGNGLEVISKGEVDCITIAGMGGSLIASILENGKAKLEGVQRLVLQPNLNARGIRQWLIDHHWELIAEEIMEEDGKVYEVLVAEKGQPLKPYSDKLEQELLVGPFLMKEKNQAFYRKWKREAGQLEVVLKNLKKAENQAAAESKKQAVLSELNWMKEVLRDEKEDS
ncbi:tRNA (adenine22-N1)-methyltransferase [Bacillus ectoiniformans]|uniref:tRNA (adenine(22)-N(1))-methyltransferase n=1 Tax=Bacillus ectoiniformans TaxID=1494429 RepID=UPI0019589FEF|nr:tRNA (adenine(22)-N(1))-methyltransferase TrmK [Bacillus ectoiniformans]MBM7650015.1 tRNA (adenine22-N1)-methyltransferase [Bacillus ectoiniformans]